MAGAVTHILSITILAAPRPYLTITVINGFQQSMKRVRYRRTDSGAAPGPPTKGRNSDRSGRRR